MKLSAYLTRRLLLFIPTLLGAITLVFLLIHLIPGDPVELMLGETALPADMEKLRRELNLDLPIGSQYLFFLRELIQLDLGQSLYYKVPVVSVIARALPATLELTAGGMAVALILAFPLGVLAAYRKDSGVDRASVFLASLGISVPHFWLGPMLILVFAVNLQLLPVSGRGGFASLILPSITLGSAMASITMRMIRAALVEAIQKEFISTARAKGLRERRVILKHALANALIPVITIIGLQLGGLLAGSLVTETIFSWPGIGRLTVAAIYARDFRLVQGCVLTIAVGYVVINLITDLAYSLVDPRIRVR